MMVRVWDWPPKNYDYGPLLKQRNLKWVQTTWDWSMLPDIDDQGFSKCLQVKGYSGVFRTAEETHDLRPYELCPNYNNLFQKDVSFLKEKTLEALNKQLEELGMGTEKGDFKVK